MRSDTISLELAQKLKNAGLVWKASIHDFFAIPGRDMDDRLFVITDMMAYLDLLRGWPVITFHGTAEWALDYIITSEVVWMPTEGQLRQELETLLQDDPEQSLVLQRRPGGYRLQVQFRGQQIQFEGQTASEVYGQTVLHLLETYF